MTTSDGSADDLARLRRERDEADALYNDALTALDGAVQGVDRAPLPPRAHDDSRLAALNEHWNLSSVQPSTGGRFGWFRTRIWAMVAPVFDRQQAFNADLVDHLNRNAEVHRDSIRAVRETLVALREEIDRLANFQNKLILYAQQVTPFVDTKDRYIEALPRGLAAGLSGLSDDIQKRWESMVARERRYDAQVADIRSTLSVVHRALLTIKRDVEQRAAPEGPRTVPAPAAATAADGSLDAYKYVGFEDEFRGSQTEIRERASTYVADFEGASDVLDVGCGRGEFLDLLAEHGVSARGVDLNEEMAALCRERGLQTTAGDALAYVQAQPDGSLGGLFAAQVVEHLEPDYLMRLLETSYHKLRPGSKIILETINPACWYAFFSSYIRDVTHVRPLHPDTLRYFLVASGFQRVEIRYSAPVSDEVRLETLPSTTDMSVVFNANVEKLNGLLFTYLDYAVIGERL